MPDLTARQRILSAAAILYFLPACCLTWYRKHRGREEALCFRRQCRVDARFQPEGRVFRAVSATTPSPTGRIVVENVLRRVDFRQHCSGAFSGHSALKFLPALTLSLALLLELCACDSVGARANLTLKSETVASGRACSNCPSAGGSFSSTERAQQRASEKLKYSATNDYAARVDTKLAFYDPDPSVTENGLSHDFPVLPKSLASGIEPGPSNIAESVFFIYRDFIASDGKVQRIPSATAFVVSVPSLDHRSPARFIVTARHVVDPEWAHCPEKNPESIEIRLNRRSGGTAYEKIRLQSNNVRRFLAPAADNDDLAIVRLDRELIPNLDSYKFIDTPFRLLPTASELQSVRIDQRITTAGLPTWTPRAVDNYPVSHGGSLSDVSTEWVSIRCSPGVSPKLLHVWFIDAGIPQGLSGAPVYTSMTRNSDGVLTPVLLGVQSVAWTKRGVAGITPASVLSDLVQTALSNPRLEMDLRKGSAP